MNHEPNGRDFLLNTDRSSLTVRSFGLACAILACLSGCDASRNQPRSLAKTAQLELYFVSATATPGTKQAVDPETGAALFLTTPAIISAADVATVQRSQAGGGWESLDVHLTPAGAKKLATATAGVTGMRLAFVINGRVISAPTLRSPLSSKLRVTGNEVAENGEQLFEELTRE